MKKLLLYILLLISYNAFSQSESTKLYYEKLFSKGFTQGLALGERGNINARLVNSNCFQFDGSTWFSFTNQNLGTTHTIHFKIKMVNSSNWTNGTVLGVSSGLGSNYSWVGLIDGSYEEIVYEISDNSGTPVYTNIFYFSDQTKHIYNVYQYRAIWLDVTIIRNGSSLKWYIDNTLYQEDNSATGSLTVGRLGNRNTFNYYLTNAYLADVRVWSIAKTIQQVMNYDTTNLILDIPLSNGKGNPTETQQALTLTKSAGTNIYAPQDHFHRNLLWGCTKVVASGDTTFYPYKQDGSVRYVTTGGETSVIQVATKTGFGPVETKIEIPFQSELFSLENKANFLYTDSAVKQLGWNDLRNLKNDYIKIDTIDAIYLKDLYLPYHYASSRILTILGDLTKKVKSNIDNTYRNVIFFPGSAVFDKYGSNPVLAHSDTLNLNNEDINEVFGARLFYKINGNDSIIGFYAGCQYPYNNDQTHIIRTTTNLTSFKKNIISGNETAVFKKETGSVASDPFGIIYDNGLYKNFYRYDTYEDSHHMSVRLATSADGYSWTSQGEVFSNFVISSHGVGAFHVIKWGKIYYAFVGYYGVSGVYLYKSTTGTSWTLVKSDILGGSYGMYPRVFVKNGRLYMFINYETSSGLYQKGIDLFEAYDPEGNWWNRGKIMVVKSSGERYNNDICVSPKWDKVLYNMYVPTFYVWAFVDVGLAILTDNNLFKY